MTKIYQSIGLMSGTSLDGIDLALIASDGKSIIERKFFDYAPYEKKFKDRLRELIFKTPTLEQIKLIENELTILHANLVNNFLSKNKIASSSVDFIGFHGQTIFHNPKKGITWQIGNAHLLAAQTKINVIADFRNRDVALGGQGAPLVPIYHFYLFANQPKPTAVLNIGGISNITYFGDENENNIEAFDICFGNAPFDDLIKEKFGRDFDENGALAKSGEVDFYLAEQILKNEIFHKKPPKSFDRNDFSKITQILKNLKIQDALATLAYIHAKVIKINLEFFKKKPRTIFVCGGGVKNLAIMDEIKNQLNEVEIKAAKEIGLNADSVEAEAFAFLAIRSFLNLPISFPKTTRSFENKFLKSLFVNSQKKPKTLLENDSALALSRQDFSSCGGVFYRA
jgi:anhydro-N-acetylmuramic acid kinase